MRKAVHQKRCDLDLPRAGKKHIPTLPQISRFNPKLTRICPQVHYRLIPVLIKTSLKRLGRSPGCDASLLATCLDQEGSPITKNLSPLQSRCSSPPILPGFKVQTVSSLTEGQRDRTRHFSGNIHGAKAFPGARRWPMLGRQALK